MFNRIISAFSIFSFSFLLVIFYLDYLPSVEMVLPCDFYLQIKNTAYYPTIASILHTCNKNPNILIFFLLGLLLFVIVLQFTGKKNPYLFVFYTTSIPLFSYCFCRTGNLADFVFFKIEKHYSLLEKKTICILYVKQYLELNINSTELDMGNLLLLIENKLAEPELSILGMRELKKYAQELVGNFSQQSIPRGVVTSYYEDYYLLYNWCVVNPWVTLIVFTLLIVCIVLIVLVNVLLDKEKKQRDKIIELENTQKIVSKNEYK